MALFNVMGLASGVDTQGLLDKLKTHHQIRLRPYQDSERSCQEKIAAWSKVSTVIASVYSSVKRLKEGAFSSFNVNKTESFIAQASSTAQEDVHSIQVIQLAKSHKLKTVAISRADTPFGGEQNACQLIISLQGGDKLQIELEKGKTCLNDITQAINQKKGGVVASILHGDDGYHLLLTAKQQGAQGNISIEVNNNKKLNDILYTRSGGIKPNNTKPDAYSEDKMISVREAHDARIEVDGIAYSRTANTINDILPGVKLELIKEARAETLAVSRHSAEVKKEIESLIAQYNAFTAQISSLSKISAQALSARQRGKTVSDEQPLAGESQLNRLVNEVNYVMHALYGESKNACRSLADIGVKTEAKSGLMTLNSPLFEAVYQRHPEEVEAIFLGAAEAQGLTDKLDLLLSKYINKNGDGYIGVTTNNLNKKISLINKQMEKTQLLIDAQIKKHQDSFLRLERAMLNINQASTQLNLLGSKN